MRNSSLNIGGRIDHVVLLDGIVTLVDIKTCGKPPAKPKNEHSEQLSVYSLLSGIEPRVLFYFSRNVATWKGELLTAQFDIDQSLDLIAERLVMTMLYQRHNKIPSVPFSSSRDCGWCDYKDYCWNGKQWDGTYEMSSLAFDDEMAPKIKEGSLALLNSMEKRKKAFINDIANADNIHLLMDSDCAHLLD